MSSIRERSEKVLEEMKEKNPYFEKYANKIAAVQQSSPEEFLSRLDSVEKEKQKPKFGPSEVDRDYSELLKPKSPLTTEATRDVSHRKLSDIMRIELVEDKSADDIMHLCQGYEFIMLQFAANTVHFTPLLNYQVHKENAPECLNMTMFTECSDKGIVLMRGEYDSKVLNAQEAQCLANQVQLYYSQNNESKVHLLETFTKNPDQFKHMDIIDELNNLKI
uniref:ATP synthase mitochondrial F1 complex assembly factor 1 n=1 Tax=Anopheles culicifacies TaxID=139723 RepID=A0A182MQW6_9DIPT